MKKENFFDRLKQSFIPSAKVGAHGGVRTETREEFRRRTGWKQHCATRSQIRRIGSRKRAIELGIVKA